MLRKITLFTIAVSFLIVNGLIFAQGEIRVNNNLSYSVGVFIDNVYSAHLSGGNYFVKILSSGSHSVRVYHTSNSSTYEVSINSGSLTILDHNSWQNNIGNSSPQDLLRVNNNLSYSVNVDVNDIYRAKIGASYFWGLRLDPGLYSVRIWTTTGLSRNYSVTITSGNDYILNHNDFDETDSVVDIDGNSYQIIQIGNQLWMSENLKVTHYRNGDAIPEITENTSWAGLTTGAFCNYDNNSNNVSTYGRLYNWYSINDNRGIAPEGWHVPSDADWKQLELFLGMSQSQSDGVGWRGTNEGGKLKETGYVHWISPNTGATNESGFKALPSGCRDNVGIYKVIHSYACFWSSSSYSSSSAYSRKLANNQSGIYRDPDQNVIGYSIRCVKDGITSIDVENLHSIRPNCFSLLHNYPNPFNPTTTISFELPEKSNIKLTIYNITGKEITIVTIGEYEGGHHKIIFNAENLPSGLYFYELKSKGFVDVKKMMVLR